uniref:Uncharacterized protein n=1 Tax=Solanum lycopersicum TaxID=4081 RepID=A0A3Q7J8B7_SOLLC
MTNGIVELHSSAMRKDAPKKLNTVSLYWMHPALLLRSNRSLLVLLWWSFFTLSLIWTGALVDRGRE